MSECHRISHGIQSTTPALLFPTISLLMLAYTNRFLTLATIVRNLYDGYKPNNDENLPGQIVNLRYRVCLIRNIQIVGVLSLLFCIISMFALFAGWITGGLDLLLTDLEKQEKTRGCEKYG